MKTCVPTGVLTSKEVSRSKVSNPKQATNEDEIKQCEAPVSNNTRPPVLKMTSVPSSAAKVRVSLVIAYTRPG